LPGVAAVGTLRNAAGSEACASWRRKNREHAHERGPEKKAAALPPKTDGADDPVFSLPVLFIVILGPTYIKVSRDCNDVIGRGQAAPTLLAAITPSAARAGRRAPAQHWLSDPFIRDG